MIKIISFLAFVLYSLNVTSAAADDQKDALELLRVALKCEPPATDDGENKAIGRLRFTGDEHTLIIETETFGVWKPSAITSTAGSESHRIEQQAAKFADFDPNYIREKDGQLLLRCKDRRLCAASILILQESCESFRDGTKKCDKLSGLGEGGSRLFSLSHICPSQMNNVKLALATLQASATQSSNARFLIQPSYGYAAAKIYERPDPKSKIISAIGKDSGPIELTNCTSSGGNWCQVNWGGIVGWVDRSIFSEKTK
jgi:hypothetical protein